MPRRRFTSRRRTSKYLGVGSSNRKNQWQARILYHGKVGDYSIANCQPTISALQPSALALL